MSRDLPSINSAARFRNTNYKIRRLCEETELSEYERASAHMLAQLEREGRATRRFLAGLIVVALGSALLILALGGAL